MVYANENFWFVWRCVLIRRSKRLLTAYNLSLNGLKHQRICWSVINTQALLFSCWTKRAETFQWLVGGLVFLLENGSSQTLFLMVFWSFQSCKTTEKVQIVRISNSRISFFLILPFMTERSSADIRWVHASILHPSVLFWTLWSCLRRFRVPRTSGKFGKPTGQTIWKVGILDNYLIYQHFAW